MSKTVIDVSAYNGVIDWKKVKAAGVEGAILKVIRRDLNPDKQFVSNWNGCEAVDMPLAGVYNYSYATTAAKARTDAQKVLSILNGRKAKVWMDVEDACLKGKGKTLIAIINAYGDVIKAAGYEFGVYTGLSFYNSYIKPWAGYLKHGFWIARYPSTRTRTIKQLPDVKKQPAILHVLEGWQWSSAGSVPGINGKVDLNIWYGKIPAKEPVGNPYPVPERVIYIPKIGPKMSGNDVKWIQYHLIRLGFLPAKNSKGKSNIDGIYGKDTKNAVLAAQKHYGIKEDGIVGARTRMVIQYN
jgi:GH25 family lysozyme M1 (1,4-beta-N-acetylmuramidase)